MVAKDILKLREKYCNINTVKHNASYLKKGIPNIQRHCPRQWHITGVTPMIIDTMKLKPSTNGGKHKPSRS